MEHREPNDAWTLYDVDVSYTTDSYEKARKKAKAIEEEIIFMSESEKELERGARPKKPAKRLDDDYVALGHRGKKRCLSLPKPPPCRVSISSTEKQPSLSLPSSPQPPSLPLDPVMQFTAWDRYVVSALENIKEELAVLKRMVAGLTTTTNTISAPDGLNLPLKSTDDIVPLEAQLEDKSFQQQLVLFLSTVGGMDVAGATRRVLATIMTNEVAMKLNWVGHGGKMAFQTLKLCKVMCEAVRRSIMPPPKDAEIEQVAKVWLRNARDRSGGRKQRLMQSLKKK
ncbi:uncharacterized protein si:dkey-172k15.5 [Astyanax mexicanus]|uniref:uncharacterized protein si:dkey-172k15.5 n=1 Tax=Astyanax mexicanus TaxID=7994 RepID=UPI0020CAE28E|nr:uncharacterized protein si:dkey-172k15.5 [Astyanax mexicanus]